MILFKDTTKIYPRNVVALENINLKIDRGEFISIVGQSGAGKTTLLKLLTLEERPTRGKIFLDGQDITLLKNSQFPFLRRRIGVVFQDFKLLEKKTVFENIAFAMEVAGFTPDEIKKDVPQILEMVGLRDKEKNFSNELSGGEKQRVSLARALVNGPEILMADEPTGNLDLLNTKDILKLLLKINALGTTVILATHNKDIVNVLNKRVVTLDSGRIILDQPKGRYMI